MKKTSNNELYRITLLNRKLPDQEFSFYEWLPSPLDMEEVEKLVKRQMGSKRNVYLLRSVEKAKVPNETRSISAAINPSTSSTTSRTRGKLVPVWKVSDDVKLKDLATDVLKIQGVMTVSFFDYKGKLVYRELRDKSLREFETDSLGLGTVALRGLSLFRAAQSSDKEIGETEFFVIGRRNFKAVFVPIAQLRAVVRLVVGKDIEASCVHDQLIPIVEDHLKSQAVPR